MPAVDGRHQHVAFHPLHIAAAAAQEQHKHYLRFDSYINNRNNNNNNRRRTTLLSSHRPLPPTFGRVASYFSPYSCSSSSYNNITPIIYKNKDNQELTPRPDKRGETLTIEDAKINTASISEGNKNGDSGKMVSILKKDQNRGHLPLPQLRVVSYYDNGEEIKEHAPGHRSVSRSAGFKLASDDNVEISEGENFSNNNVNLINRVNAGQQRRVEGEIEEIIDYVVDPEFGGPPKFRRHSRTLTTTERRQSQPGVSIILETSACAVEEFVAGKDLIPELLQQLQVINNKNNDQKIPTAPFQRQESSSSDDDSSKLTDTSSSDEPQTSSSEELHTSSSSEEPQEVSKNIDELARSLSEIKASILRDNVITVSSNNNAGSDSNVCTSSSSSSLNAVDDQKNQYRRQHVNWRSAIGTGTDLGHRRYSTSSSASSTASSSSSGYVPCSSSEPLVPQQQPHPVMRKLNSFPTSLSSTFTRSSYPTISTTNGGGYSSRYASMRIPSSQTDRINNLLLNHHISKSARSASLIAKYL